MKLFDHISEINYLAVVLAVLSSFVVGSLWYMWSFWGESWARLVGLTKDQVEKPEPVIYLRTAIGGFAAAWLLALIIVSTEVDNVLGGLTMGLVIGLAFRFTSIVMHNDFAHHPARLSLIDGGHDAVQLAVMGAIIAAVA